MPRRSKIAPWVRIVRERPAVYGGESFDARSRIIGPRDLVALVAPRLEIEEQEVFVAVSLDTQHRVLGLTEVSRGTVNQSLVHPREVFRTAIALGAAALVVAHNHPSGDATPSAADRTVTEQLIAAGKVLGLPVHDHIIIGAPGKYVSFAEAGLL